MVSCRKYSPYICEEDQSDAADLEKGVCLHYIYREIMYQVCKVRDCTWLVTTAVVVRSYSGVYSIPGTEWCCFIRIYLVPGAVVVDLGTYVPSSLPLPSSIK